VPASISSVCQELRSLLAGFDAGVFSGADCLALAEELSATEKACAAARLLAAARAVQCKAFEEKGFNDGADWLARQSGTTPGEAKRNLNTARRLGDKTKEALLAGKLSLDQAEEITNTASEVPGSEEELVELARRLISASYAKRPETAGEILYDLGRFVVRRLRIDRRATIPYEGRTRFGTAWIDEELLYGGLLNSWYWFYGCRSDVSLKALQIVLPDGACCFRHQTTQPLLGRLRKRRLPRAKDIEDERFVVRLPENLSQ
jgi:hypothetical protein